MTTINEELEAQDWLKGYLEDDGTLMGMLNGGVYFRSTPTGVRTPVVKMDRLDGNDLMVLGMHRVWADLTYLIRGVTQGPDWSDVKEIAHQLDTLLHRTAGESVAVTAPDGTAMTVYVNEIFREEPFTDETTEGGNYYLHAGGVYRLRVQAF